MPFHFATIITASHIPYARTLCESLKKNCENDFKLHCLIVDRQASQESTSEIKDFQNEIILYNNHECLQNQGVAALFPKYATTSMDSLRWSLKPVFVAQLLKSNAIDAVAFVDSDQFFIGSPAPLFTDHATSRFILSPHDRTVFPDDGQEFHDHLTDGIFNGGLFVARRDAIEILDWWAMACAYRCEKNKPLGLFVDQRYLDLIPTQFSGSTWFKHKGLNVASWNIRMRPRLTSADGLLTAAGDPIICVHFSANTIRTIDDGEDRCLEPVLSQYRRTLMQYGVNLPRQSNYPTHMANETRVGWRLLHLERLKRLGKKLINRNR